MCGARLAWNRMTFLRWNRAANLSGDTLTLLPWNNDALAVIYRTTFCVWHFNTLILIYVITFLNGDHPLLRPANILGNFHTELLLQLVLTNRLRNVVTNRPWFRVAISAMAYATLPPR